MDGGANDEGWHQAWCSYCNRNTEHGRGSGCVPCGDRIVSSKAKQVKTVKAVNLNPFKLDRWAVLKLYEVSEGPLYGFLKSLKESNEMRSLTSKQVEVGAKVLGKVIDVDIIDRLWSRITVRNENMAIEVGSIVRLKSAVNPMVVIDDNGRGEILLENLESGTKSWCVNDDRWLVIK